MAFLSILQLGSTPFYKRLIGTVVRTKVSKVEEGLQKAPTKPRLMTSEFVSVTLEIFLRASPRLDQCSPTESRPQPLECLSCKSGTNKARRGQLNDGESCKLLLFKD